MINLKEIDSTIESDCIALNVAEAQRHLIAPNEKSIEWAKRNASCIPLAIQSDANVVGFVMYEPRGNDVFSIHRVMVDAQYQRQGIGRKAMILTIEQIKNLGGITIYLSFRPENETARLFFQGLGFVEYEIEPDGEVIYRLGPPRELAF